MSDEPEVYYDAAEAQEEHIALDVETPCEFRTGRAGTGKTYQTLAQVKADPKWGMVMASTGIAAINLNTTTINSCLGYFDTDSLRDNYLSGQLTRKLHELAKDYRNLVIDEGSMMAGEQLDIIYQALGEANRMAGVPAPMGIIIVGDFAQLPPVKARWLFEAACWPRFAERTTRLEKVWRQGAGPFLDALNAARSGDGATAAELLTQAGARWETMLDTEFDGSTIVPKNDAVDRFNWISMQRVKGRDVTVVPKRWGKQRGEWKNIGEQLTLRIGALVMILANQSDGSGAFEFVNGDLGHVREYDSKNDSFAVELVRDGSVVDVGRVCRSVAQKDRPEGWPENDRARIAGFRAGNHRDDKGRYVTGQVWYHPLRVAYATTVHKSQGVSLDKCQIDFRDHFFGSYNMMYVALSRCRTLEGLRLVGMREKFVKQVNVDPRVREWL